MLNYNHPETKRMAKELGEIIAKQLLDNTPEMIIDLHGIKTEHLPNQHYPTVQGKMVSIAKDGSIMKLNFEIGGSKLFDKVIEVVKG